MKNDKFWTPQDQEDLKLAQSYTDLSKIAVRIVTAMPDPIIEVCGPISTGGLGSIEANLERFADTIDFLLAQGNLVFDQMPFEDKMMELKAQEGITGSSQRLLDEFYVPIFESGQIKSFYFMPDWQSSTGACWEHDQAKRLGIDIVYLEEGYLSQSDL